MSDLRKDNLCDLCSSNFFLVYAMTPNLSICAGLILLVQIGILTNKFTFLLFSFSKTLFSSTPFFLLNLKSKCISSFFFLYQFSQSKFFLLKKNDMKNISLLFSISIHSIYSILLLCHFLMKIKKR